ncbi:hypothetical protein [Paenibacillus piri]|uniref:O-antigen ligase domain-containing protein n=1 Tax=Paenibacillus piri TaxID=2547395 RepID=A0A4R5KYI6_9BACL|nr:hypothetical protein [Paenibacillus piri]TDG00309.1 hypothetical protein E1757_01300 [Paenibacillus piri]
MNTILQKNWLDNKYVKWFAIACCVLLLGYALGMMAIRPSNIRLLLAASLLLLLFAFSLRQPIIVLYLLMIYMPFLALFRRMLIPLAGWNSIDPLLLVQPIIVLVLFSRWLYAKYIGRQEITDDTPIFRMIRWMMLVDFLQIFNPLQGSLLTGFAGVIYYFVPVCFVIISREYFDEAWMKRMFATIFVIGIIVALYGYKQFLFGFSSFEEQWIEISGFTALKVYSVTRPIGTFSSGSEYAHYLGIAAIIGWAYVLRHRSGMVKLIGLLALGLLYSALFIESARGVIVTVTAALTVITIMSTKSTKNKVLLALLSAAVLSGLFVGMSKLNTDNDLIYHSVSGLTDPFGEHSTVDGHLSLMRDGFQIGLLNPLGHGLGSTTIAGAKFSGAALSSEVDLSNKLMATGIVGGTLYFLIIIRTLYAAFRQVKFGHISHLIILGVLIAEGGQWLTGGHYSIMGPLWLMIGYLDKTSAPLQNKNKPLRKEKEEGAYH